MSSTLKPSLMAGVALLCLGSALTHSQAAETILYSTDFSNFEVGDDKLAGNDGWMATNEDQAVHGTIADVFGNGNVGGTLGFEIPLFAENQSVVTAWRPINIDPIADDTLIRFSTNMAIIDSDNELYDSFYFSVYNQNADVLGGVVFDNTEESGGIWRFDGTDNGFDDLGLGFDFANLYDFSFTVDFANNEWSARLDDITLFEKQPFTAVEDADRNLGDIAVEWEVTDPENPGTNWVYFDDWTVTEVTRETTTTIDFTPTIVRGPSGKVRLNWPAESGDRFIVEHSSNLVDWSSTLAGADFTVSGNTGARFVDDNAGTDQPRYYRVRRP